MQEAYLANGGGDVRGARVAHRHRRVLCEQEVGHGDADNVGAANDDGTLPVDRDVVALEQLDAALYMVTGLSQMWPEAKRIRRVVGHAPLGCTQRPWVCGPSERGSQR